MALRADTFVEIDDAMRQTGVEGGADTALRYLLRELRALSQSNVASVPLSTQDRERLDAEGFTDEAHAAKCVTLL